MSATPPAGGRGKARKPRHVADAAHPAIIPTFQQHRAAHLKRSWTQRWRGAVALHVAADQHRSPSLRARVALSAGIGTLLIVTMIGIPLWFLIEEFNMKQADTSLDRLTTVVEGPITRTAAPDPGLDFSARFGPGLGLARGIELPDLPEGFATAKLDGRMYRVNTVRLGGPGSQYKLALAEPLDPTLKHIDEQHRLIVLVGLAAVAAGWVLGWLLGGFAVRPLRELAAATRQVASSGAVAGVKTPATQPAHYPRITGAREVEAIAEAMRAMLARIAEERATSDAALATARDFALLSAHELRTPLTAMRTNLEILSLHDIPPDDQGEIVGDVLRTQRRVEDTLAALEHLAAHELNTDDDYADVDLNDLLDQTVVDAGRANPAVTVRLVAASHITTRAVRAGLRLAVDNAITNAVRHGAADRVVVAITADDDNITIAVDDNGCGVPEKQRDVVFRRFVRGSTAKGPGSGLGMALIHQQAQIHHGAATLDASPLGGARLTITLPQHQPTPQPDL